MPPWLGRGSSSLPMSRRFQAAVFSRLTGCCKPDPRSFHPATGGLYLPPSDCLFVGDDGRKGEMLSSERAALPTYSDRVDARGYLRVSSKRRSVHPSNGGRRCVPALHSHS